jgi:hypothetical protein
MDRIDRNTENAVRRFLKLIADRFQMAGAIVFGSRASGTKAHRACMSARVLLEFGDVDGAAN